MDFSKESTKDLHKHGVDNSIPTFWLLEGLIMYLTKEDVASMFSEITSTSVKGSLILVNFYQKNPPSNANYVQSCLDEKDWKMVKTTFYGDKDLNYGRYPKDQKTSDLLGFAIYERL